MKKVTKNQFANSLAELERAAGLKSKRSRSRPIRALMRDEAIKDIQRALQLAMKEYQSKPPSPAEIKQSIERLRNRCGVARRSYEQVLNNNAMGKPLLSALPEEAEWIDVVRELGDTIGRLVLQEKWFTRAEKIATERVVRGRRKGPVKSRGSLGEAADSGLRTLYWSEGHAERRWHQSVHAIF